MSTFGISSSTSCGTERGTHPRTPVLGGFAALRVPQRTAMALDLVGCSPVGEDGCSGGEGLD